jgi:hypothetical protein
MEEEEDDDDDDDNDSYTECHQINLRPQVREKVRGAR